MSADEPKVKRLPVDTIFTALNPEFMRRLAKIASYASEKYGSWEQYTRARLDGEKSCISHAIDHVMHYQAGDRYDHFDGATEWHLVAAAYNLMMQFYYHSVFGPEPSPWRVVDLPEVEGEAVAPPVGVPEMLGGAPQKWSAVRRPKGDRK